jgi:polyribonucleotide nucleotidyltransferase
MISDITAVPEVGKTYLGKVVRIAEFGAFVEIFPGTDGLLHVSEIAEHRVKEVKDELREGDQILVKVLSIEGNRIKLSRKAVLREQRAKLGLPEPDQPSPYGAPRHNDDDDAEPGDEGEVLIEGGGNFDDDDEGPADSDPDSNEPNFNRADNAPVPVGSAPSGRGDRGPGGGGGGFRPSGDRGGDRGPGGGGGRTGGGGGRRRRGGSGRRPGGPGGPPQGGGGGNR